MIKIRIERRPRRVGPLDLVATRYGVQVQGATALALTKLDVLSYLQTIPVCTQYELAGSVTDEFPFPAALAEAKPVYTELGLGLRHLRDPTLGGSARRRTALRG